MCAPPPRTCSGRRLGSARPPGAPVPAAGRPRHSGPKTPWALGPCFRPGPSLAPAPLPPARAGTLPVQKAAAPWAIPWERRRRGRKGHCFLYNRTALLDGLASPLARAAMILPHSARCHSYHQHMATRRHLPRPSSPGFKHYDAPPRCTPPLLPASPSSRESSRAAGRPHATPSSHQRAATRPPSGHAEPHRLPGLAEIRVEPVEKAPPSQQEREIELGIAGPRRVWR